MTVKNRAGSCGCCGPSLETCPLWTLDFNISRLTAKPTDKQYYQPNSVVGIASGSVGEGLLFQLNTSGNWAPNGWYAVPLLTSDPDSATLDVQLLSDSTSNHVYYYKKLLSGVERIYEISYGGSPVLKDISFTVTLTAFNPWQDNGTTPNGLVLSTSSDIAATGTLPVTPWVIAFENVVTSESYATVTPFWLDATDSGMQVEFVNTATSASIAKFKLRRRPALTTAFSYPNVLSGIASYDYYDVTDAHVILEVQIEGGSWKVFRLSWPAPASVLFRSACRFFFIDGMIGFSASGGQAFEGTDSAITTPPIFAQSSKLSWEITNPPSFSMEVTAFGTNTIIGGLKMVATRQKYFTSTTTGSGETLAIINSLTCEDDRICASVFPHGAQQWELVYAEADAASFYGPAASRQQSLCTHLLSTLPIDSPAGDGFTCQISLSASGAASIQVQVDARVVYSGEASRARFRKTVPRWLGLSPPIISFGASEFVTVLSGAGDHGGVWDIANLEFEIEAL